MTLHLPSRRLVAFVFAGAATLAVVTVIVLDWRTIIGWAVLFGLLRWRYGRRSGRTLIETLGLTAGGVLGWRGLRSEARRREELHAASVETEQARAEELRSRVEYRKRTRAEQERAERSAYWQGAIDGGH